MADRVERILSSPDGLRAVGEVAEVIADGDHSPLWFGEGERALKAALAVLTAPDAEDPLIPLSEVVSAMRAEDNWGDWVDADWVERWARERGDA